MSSRQAEKERRRQARLAREQAVARGDARRKRLQLVGGVVLAGAAAAALAVAIASGMGGGDGDGGTQPSEGSGNLPKLPAQQASDLDQAAKAAGCQVVNPASEGAAHDSKTFTAADYRTNPPTSGTHFPQWADDGIYAAGETPPLGQLVHTLEHGRVNVQYTPGTPRGVVAKLQAVVAENQDGYHMLLYENPTRMRYQVAATAWTHLLGCRRYTDKAIDALRAFRTRYIDKGPEQVP